MLYGLLIGGVAILLFAVLVYPGELSLFGPRANRWLYDRSAENYQGKWQSAAYRDQAHRDRITQHVRDSIGATGVHAVLDLGCGTGRGIRITGGTLDPGTQYTGVDFSAEMLTRFQAWLQDEGRDIAPRVQLLEAELGQWAARTDHPQYGAVFLLEVGEFLPSFVEVVERLASLVPPGGGLVMTRPACMWWIFFPGRRQSRRALGQLLQSVGFEPPDFIPWRKRYEFVLTRKVQQAAAGA